MTDIRGIHYELSKPFFNKEDGYWYQRHVDDGQVAPNGHQPDSDGPVGLFSGKPMRFPFAAIFQTGTPPAAASDPNQRSALDDLIWNGRGSRTSSPDAVAAPRLAPDRYISFGNANGLSSSLGDPGAAFPPVPASPDSQGPLSLNGAYLEHLRWLNAS